MFLINEPLIKRVQVLDNNVVIITWQQHWYQEEIDNLVSVIFHNVESTKIIESVIGADRHCCRFNYRTGHYVLNFEYYSQSCWIEAEDELSNVFISTIAQDIAKII